VAAEESAKSGADQQRAGEQPDSGRCEVEVDGNEIGGTVGDPSGVAEEEAAFQWRQFIRSLLARS
jgi:hypothetical protein